VFETGKVGENAGRSTRTAIKPAQESIRQRQRALPAC